MPREESFVLEGASRRAIERRLFGNRTKVRIDESASPVTRAIARGYRQAWNRMQGLVLETAEEAARLRHSEASPSPREIARMDRVDRAMFALERQVRELSKFTGVKVTGAAAGGFERTVATVLDDLPSLTGVDRAFTRPSGAAMQGLVLRMTGQIEADTLRLTAVQQTALKDGLFRGLVLGENPRTTAREIVANLKGAFLGGFSRAENIARTEIADAHRYATRLAYGDDLIVGWKWLAVLSARTCPACWAMHNTFHEKSEMQFGHQRCRCTMVPVLVDDMPYDHDLGDPEALFWNLPRETQLQIMGPGRLKALEGGVRFTDLTYLKTNPGWRPSQAVTRVSDLLGIAELNVATFPGDVIDVPTLTNASLMGYAFAQGGLTINTLTGDQPTSGFVVARAGTSAVIDAREFFGPAGPNITAAWLKRHGDLLDEPGAHMGMWYDQHNGKVVLDVVQILDDRDAAIALGRAEDQIAIFDLDTFTEIATGGSGGYISNALLPAEVHENVKVGDVVRAVVNGEEIFGTVVERPSFSDATVVERPDGSKVTLWPDQIIAATPPVDSSAQMRAERERIEKVLEEVRRVVRETDTDTVNFSGMPVEIARRVADTYIDVANDWDDVNPIVLESGQAGGAFAVTNTNFLPGHISSAIAIDRGYAAKPSLWESDMQGAEDRGHFHRGTADDYVDYTVEHEFGHAAEFALFGDPRTPEGIGARAPMGADLYNSIMASFRPEGDFERIDPNADDVVERVSRAFQNPAVVGAIEVDLSGYAVTSLHELLAEGFAVYRDHGPGASVAADAIMRGFARRYREKFGRWPRERDLERIIPEYRPDE